MKIIIIIFLLIFTYDSELFNVYLGGTVVFLFKIFLFLISFVNLIVKKSQPNRQENLVIFLLVLINLYISSITIINTGLQGILWSFKYFIRFYFLYYLIQNLKMYHLNIFIKWYRVLAIILSIQSILLFVIIYLDIPLEKTIISRHSDEDVFQSFGIFGFGNVNTSYSFRTQSFFSEATNFAKFLVLPFFSYVNDFLKKREKHLLLKAFIILTALFSTFSLTAFIGVVVGLFLLLIIRNINKSGIFVGVSILSLLSFGLYKVVLDLIGIGVDKKTTNLIIGGIQKGDASVDVRTDYLFDVINLIYENPFGIGYDFRPFLDGTLPMAPSKWLIFGGWFVLLLVLLLQSMFFNRWRKSLNSHYYVLFLVVCISHFLISLIHGTWTEFIYWINFIFLLKLSHWHKVKSQI